MSTPLVPLAFRRLLVEQPAGQLPAGWQLVDERMVGGLPHRLRLADGFDMLVVVPTGLATAWRDAPDGAVVTSGDAERASTRGRLDTPGPGSPRATARLVLMRGNTPAGAVPLSVGRQVLLPEANHRPGLRIMLAVLDWDLRAGSMRGPGDFGSRVALGWSAVDGAVAGWPLIRSAGRTL